jgi:FkbM family methyltransferase
MGVTSWIFTELRSVLRQTGLLPHVVHCRNLILGGPASYEQAFTDGLQRAIRPGDVVWDVGANLGHYTQRFHDWAGSEGVVYAFEPAPACFDSLSNRFSDKASVVVMNLALGEREATLPIALADDALGATHSLVSKASEGGRTVNVNVVAGDALVANATARAPNVLKIDVEGFEEEVLRGLASTLKNSSVRAVFCEIHFGLLDQRGERHAPERIERMLRSHGYQTKWIDASHLSGTR